MKIAELILGRNEDSIYVPIFFRHGQWFLDKTISSYDHVIDTINKSLKNRNYQPAQISFSWGDSLEIEQLRKGVKYE